MPRQGDGERRGRRPLAGRAPEPDRTDPSHSFVGVDYDLDPGAYEGDGLPSDARDRVLGRTHGAPAVGGHARGRPTRAP